MAERIRISWDDVNRPEIDETVKRQESLAKAQRHVQSQSESPPFSGDANYPAQRSAIIPAARFVLSSHVVMAALGIIASLLAWGIGELLMQLPPRDHEQFHLLIFKYEKVELDEKMGHISKQQADRLATELDRYRTSDPEISTNPYVRVFNEPSLSERERHDRLNALFLSEHRRLELFFLIYFTIAGVVLAVALAIAEPLMNRNGRQAALNASLAVVLGMVGAILNWFIATQIYQSMGGGQLNDSSGHLLARQVFARAAAWAFLGAFLVIAPGIVSRSFKKTLIGFCAGLLGGLIAGVSFDVISQWTQGPVLSRLIALLIIGGFTGIAFGIIENVVKSGWLKVAAGLIAGKQFILYRNPTIIGSSPQCEIYLFKDPQVRPQHAAIHRIPGGFELEDLSGATFLNGSPIARSRLKSFDQIQIGDTVLVFQEKRDNPHQSPTV